MDNPELTAEQIGAARPFAEAVPELAKTFRTHGPGKKPAKVSQTLRLDREVLEAWRASGPGWQSRMNDALRKAMPHA
ncbi:BrnA antitoxin family protein [Novosphingobium sp. JCM 18896]|uniref:BrnA antitoxin family protein n=1 Tax=Novosphingobium sp. JCM 18896 TaxID=2989731 RepID=UPI0022214123|nr:BrnA antitoxin family protein [Novosphingobium sp. JCM 18896]MCW1430893.1 BrnA antitoxin family protein [Novosphingobium sp. JCM 18896]